MNTIKIQYCFKLDEHTEEIFNLTLDEQNIELLHNTPKELPYWTNLDFHKCPHCKLNISTHPNCPVAANLVDIAMRFDNIVSYDEIDLEVITSERCISRHTTAQKGIGSLIGLVIAASGCPQTKFFKPMARFHLPLANMEETIFRAVSMYLLFQYFLIKEGEKGDFELKGLSRIYNNLHLLNTAIAERLRAATQTDSSINAIIMLDLFTTSMPHAIEQSMDELRHLFTPYLKDSGYNIS